jgi:hypothetical protein
MGLGLKECKSLASRMFEARPRTDNEYDASLATWKRCINACADNVVPMKYHAAFLIACERGGIWPN